MDIQTRYNAYSPRGQPHSKIRLDSETRGNKYARLQFTGIVPAGQ